MNLKTRDDVHRPKVIAGSGRSGTTWILDAIAEANRAKTVFEPLHPTFVPGAILFSNQYIPEHASFLELQRFMDRVFSGKLNSIWANYRVPPDRLCFWSKQFPLKEKYKDRPAIMYKALLRNYVNLVNQYFKYGGHGGGGLVVKFIRANLMLGWIKENYNARIVLVIRHPAGVISSRLKLIEKPGSGDWGYRATLMQYQQNKLLKTYYPSLGCDFQKPMEHVTGQAVIWCVENLLPLAQAREKGYCVIFYEDLIADPKPQWKKIAQALDLQNVPDEEAQARPSQLASVDMKTGSSPESRITSWKRHLTEVQLMQIDMVLKAFDVKAYDIRHPMPVNRAI